MNSQEVSYDDSQLRNVSERRKRIAAENRAKFSEAAKAKLIEQTEKKFKTTFIGALNQFEKKFGFLWGYEDKGVSLDEDQLELKEILEEEGFDASYFQKLWQEVRTAILHNGNNQSRALQEEIGQHQIAYNRFTLTMPVKPLD